MKIAPALTIALFAASVAATAAAAPQMTAKQILNTTTTATGQPIAMPRGAVRVIGSIVTIPPGFLLAYHKHPYPRIAYVLSGVLDVHDKSGATRRYAAGSLFVETLQSWHRAHVEGRTAVRLLVLDEVPPSAQTNTVQMP